MFLCSLAVSGEDECDPSSRPLHSQTLVRADDWLVSWFVWMIFFHHFQHWLVDIAMGSLTYCHFWVYQYKDFSLQVMGAFRQLLGTTEPF